MNKSKFLFTTLLFLFLTFTLSGCTWLTSQKQGEISKFLNKPVIEIKQEATLSIDYDGEKPNQEFTLPVEATTTVFDLLKETKLEIGIKQYDFGILITSLNEVKGGIRGRYWQYYVNGKLAPVAADQQKVNPGDKVEWRFEESNF